MRRLLLTLAAVAAIAAPAASTGTASNAPLQVDFVKHVVDPATLTFAGFLQLMPATAG